MCIFNVPQHSLLKNRNCQSEKSRERRFMDWYLLLPMSCVSSSTWDEEYCKRYLPSHTTSASAGTKSRHVKPTTNFRSFWAGNQRERRKLPEHMQRQCNSKKRHPTVIRVFFLQYIGHQAGWWHCAKGFLGILQTVRLQVGLCKRRKGTVDEESLISIWVITSMVVEYTSPAVEVSEEKGGQYMEILCQSECSTWKRCLVWKHSPGATELGVGQSKAEDRLTSTCTRDCTEALEQAAEGNA